MKKKYEIVQIHIDVVEPDDIDLKKIRNEIYKEPKDAYYETRSMINAKINIDDKQYNVFVSHFGLAKTEQINAINTLKENINGLDSVIFMGDLNMEPNNDNIKEISKLLNTYNTVKKSFPSNDPKIRIDYIFLSRDIKCLKSEVLDVVFSDHLPVVAIIE